MNAGIENDPLMRLVADLPLESSETARAARVRARCRQAMQSRKDRADRALERRDARHGVLSSAFFRIWYSLGGSARAGA